MKVLHINTYDHGGAAKACIRLHTGLLNKGIDSKLLLREKLNSVRGSYKFAPKRSMAGKFERKFLTLLFVFGMIKFPAKAWREIWQNRINKKIPRSLEQISFPTSDLDITESPLYREADIVHLHWVSDFLDYKSFFYKNRKPVVWTLHDMEPFQGGLHYNEMFYQLDASGVPVKFDLPPAVKSAIAKNHKVKSATIRNAKDVAIVAPSRWLTTKAKEGDLFNGSKFHTIPYGLDTAIFKPRDKQFSREILNLPPDKVCLLFIADNVITFRKGFALLREAVTQMNEDKIILCAVGSNSVDVTGKNVRAFGRIEDERMMSIIYSSVDAFIIPSLEDNLPNTVLESLVCGTPVIGFPVGGISDMVQDGVNGYLTKGVGVSQLKDSIDRFLKSMASLDRNAISQKAREKYDSSVQADAYADLYRSILHRV